MGNPNQNTSDAKNVVRKKHVVLPLLKAVNLFSVPYIFLFLQQELKMERWGKKVAFADIMQHNLTLFKTTVQCCRKPARPPMQIPLQTIRKYFSGRIKD